ncbi:hypothetical protein [Prosthecobacter vanneervenii]|uniref:Uncharacterized protein n=1 Tax=Prosthecobacter vanneervenii TaxID=48466 RepID=A0A7W7Y8Y7_9BACT|nr:hypothetical protein [Prosthecobacter vanneervenii]MBB5031769.1 hypothetical protein [Prosthecobacter vanneervenii]
MKFSTMLFFAVSCLSACCGSRFGKVSTTAPYGDFGLASAASYSRAYLRVMTAESIWRKSKDTEVILCGALGCGSFKPGITVDEAIKRVHGDQFYSSFYNVAVWRPNTAALYGVRFPPKRSAEPSGRTLASFENLRAGDVIIILERAICF